MKTTIKTEKTVIEQLREIRDKVSLDIKDLSFEALKEYINEQKTLHPIDIWKKNV
jgi:hypothetical protein